MTEVVDLDPLAEETAPRPRVSGRRVLAVAIGQVAGRLGRRRALQVGGCWFLGLCVLAVGLHHVAVTRAAVAPGPVMFGGVSVAAFLAVVVTLPVVTGLPGGVAGSAAEVTLGRFAAVWSLAVALLLVGAPLEVWAGLEGGVGPARAGAVVLTQVVLLGVVAAVSLALPTVAACAVVLGLLLGPPLAYGVAARHERARVQVGIAQGHAYDEVVTRTDRIWWLTAADPLVIVADANAGPPVRDRDFSGAGYDGIFYGGSDPATPDLRGVRAALASDDPLGALRSTVRGLRPGPVWPWGLGFDLALAVAALVVTGRRLARRGAEA